ncbi:MAG: SpoVA/SpoVAEb family sporulation membrane protein [Bacilli bacterium]|nr:SpoVA/SpoVAEb family sporulation membrane protein [Bacilli bacterium]MBO6194934.1 SpoVA/SpoVAEb family sporulation membrane protein [Bacilli bacterium]
MMYINSFLFAGIVCLIGQIILDNTKLMPGHITSLFVVIGAALDVFSIYDFFIEKFGAGALVCITSFGHSLIHGALSKAHSDGILGLFTGMFSLTATGITATIIFAFIFSIIFKARD